MGKIDRQEYPSRRGLLAYASPHHPFLFQTCHVTKDVSCSPVLLHARAHLASSHIMLLYHRFLPCSCSCSCSDRHVSCRVASARRSYIRALVVSLKAVLSDDCRVWRGVPAGGLGQPQHHKLLPEWRVLKRTGTGRRRSVSIRGGRRVFALFLVLLVLLVLALMLLFQRTFRQTDIQP